ncbi:hypothetical protein [Paenibacillus sanguinis]|uniref:hypothetical protein n=1 Tax=Paenibacillus sanguinis TaxID=225906 RepID=UPI00036AA34D|nr:hypothetical protein [Paenibacillus sanguinis]
MIVLSLPDSIAWLHQQDHSAFAAFIGLTILASLYGASRYSLSRNEQTRLEYITLSLERYAAALASLINVLDEDKISDDQRKELNERLLACRTAPYASENALSLISTFMAEGDETRLPVLLRTIENESEQLIAERNRLIDRRERPGWGSWIWRVCRPLLPVLCIFALGGLLLGSLGLLHTTLYSSSSIESISFSWIRMVSAWLSLLLIYLAIASGPNRHPRALSMRLLALFTGLLVLLHLVGGWLAPYILGVQGLLVLAGFRLNGRKPRKSRPYAGHTDPVPVVPVASSSAASKAESSPPLISEDDKAQ